MIACTAECEMNTRLLRKYGMTVLVVWSVVAVGTLALLVVHG